MTYKVLDEGSENPTYILQGFWDFVLVSMRVAPLYVFRTHLYAMGGWLFAVFMALPIVEITRNWVYAQIGLGLLLFLMSTWAMLHFLRKEWEWGLKSNILRKVPKQ